MSKMSKSKLVYSLPNLSEEQLKVISAIGEGANAKVSGVAGCGKTTTILGICTSFQSKKILVLTYNARLKIETREKVDKLGLTNTEVHSYHAMCVRYYTKNGAKDDGIIETVKRDLAPKRQLDFDILILDECQDMTKCYYCFVNKLILDNATKDVQFCLFGDEKQNVFEFKGADERFLTHGQKLFSPWSRRPWKELNVHTSFRVTNEIAGFINTYLIGYNKVKACKKGPPVRYMYIRPFNIDCMYREVLYYLKQGYNYDDIFILAPSIKKKEGVSPSPVIRLENMLVENGHLCYAPTSDESKIDEEVIKGKIVFSTFHQVKGLERPVVIVFNFDLSYFKFYTMNEDRDRCPNVIYVATTRALENLTVIHACDQEPILPSITYDRITHDSNVLVVGEMMEKVEFNNNHGKKREFIPIAVTDLFRHLDAEVIMNAIKMIDYITSPTDMDTKRINLPQKVICTTKGTSENVYDINGYAIPTFFQMTHCNSSSILDHIQYDTLDDSQKRVYNIISYKFGEQHTLPIHDLLYICTLYDANVNGYIHRTKQITNYDWLTSKDLERCMKTMRTNIGTVKDVAAGIGFELVYKDVPFLSTCYRLFGIVDIIHREQITLWEIKCTSSVNNEHILQLALYAWMTRVKDRCAYEYKLLNVCSGDIVTLLYNHEKVTDMIAYLIKCKYDKRKKMTDTEFIQDCLKNRNGI
jgi:hypothetical protein